MMEAQKIHVFEENPNKHGDSHILGKTLALPVLTLNRKVRINMDQQRIPKDRKRFHVKYSVTGKLFYLAS
jgi:hypothetical protein